MGTNENMTSDIIRFDSQEYSFFPGSGYEFVFIYVYILSFYICIHSSVSPVIDIFPRARISCH